MVPDHCSAADGALVYPLPVLAAAPVTSFTVTHSTQDQTPHARSTWPGWAPLCITLSCLVWRY
jgi:hypothetical protein